MKITKSKVECYKLRKEIATFGEGWANITIDVTGSESGHISITSDFGAWQHFWSHCGMPFKKFLTTVEKDYVARKFGAKDYQDISGTILNYKQHVLEGRRFGIDKKKARKIYDEIKTLEQHWFGQKDFEMIMVGLPNLMSYFDGIPEASRTYHPLFLRFWDELWHPFIEHLKQEILNDGE